MTSWIKRSCAPVLASACVFSLFCQGALAETIIPFPETTQTTGTLFPGGTTSPIATETVRTVHRLTRNKVADANPFIKHGVIYWERFGGDQGDTEIFSYNTQTRQRTRETRNRREDTLQGPGVWLTSHINPVILDENGLVDTSVYNDPKLRRISNRNARRTEIMSVDGRITYNRRQEKSVQVADNPADGMVWLSRRVSQANPIGIIQIQQGYDVFWYNGETKQTSRLTDTANLGELAFDGTWAVWAKQSQFIISNSDNQNPFTMHNVHTGETRTIDAVGANGFQAANERVMYQSSFYTDNSGEVLDGAYLYSRLERRVMLYDTASDTTIEVGADDDLGYHRDLDPVLSDQYVAYDRSFQNPFRLFVTGVYPQPPLPPDITELRLYDIDAETDILVTEGQRIDGLQIDDHTLVWEMLDTSDPLEENWDMEIFAYDILSEEIRQITDNTVDDRMPQIDGQTIVWTTYYKNGQTEIFYERAEQVLSSIYEPIFDFPIVDFLKPVEAPDLAVVVTVPEPASAAMLSLAGLGVLRRSRRSGVQCVGSVCEVRVAVGLRG